MTKKRPDTSAIANELQHSPFFTPVTTAPPPAPVPRETPVSQNAPASPPVSPRPTPRDSGHPVLASLTPQTSSPEPSVERSPEPSIARPIHPPIHRSVERSIVRTKERHSFDIWADQLFSLKELAMARERLTGTRVLLGDLVQEALENFLAHERRTESTNDRSND